VNNESFMIVTMC